MAKSFDFDCIVIGGGPGGLVAALYLSRYRRKTMIVDAGQPRARWIPRIRNLIGYAEGLTGDELLSRLRKQVKLYKVDIMNGRGQVKKIPGGFSVEVSDQSFTARKVIIATGMTDVDPEIPNLDPVKRSGLLGYCPVCDGYDHYEQKVGLLVKDSHGLKKIPFIQHLSPRLHVIQVKKFELPPFYKNLKKKVNFRIYEGDVKKIEIAGEPRRLIIRQKGRRPIILDFAYIALGTKVDTGAVKYMKGLKRTKDGFFMVDAHQQTAISGLYAVGDCVSSLSQVSVAIGQAAIAATHAHNQIGFRK